MNALPQHWQFAVDHDGGVYFSSNWKGARGLFYSPWANGRHADAVPLGAPINANGSEGMPFVAKDGSYLLFSRNMDIWVSFRGPNGAWKAPVRLPSPINTEDTEICPTVSPDGRYLFFLRGELMWVDAGVIEEMRAGRGVESAARTLLAGMAWATQAHRAGNSPGFPRYVARRVGALALAGAVFHYLGANECSVRPARLRGVRALAMGVSG